MKNLAILNPARKDLLFTKRSKSTIRRIIFEPRFRGEKISAETDLSVEGDTFVFSIFCKINKTTLKIGGFCVSENEKPRIYYGVLRLSSYNPGLTLTLRVSAEINQLM